MSICSETRHIEQDALSHERVMTQALALASEGRCTVSPNPMVGCILVKNGLQIGSGYHQQAGGPHAEIVALQVAGEAARGATAYVTLEPCSHTGKTGPCADALIAAGIRNVYVACEDPNPLVAGKGIARLRAAGIHVEVGVCATAAIELNRVFFHYIKQKRPFVIAKWAMSLDGKTVTQPHDARAISGAEIAMATHALRQQVDAILVGAETVRQDNPQLTARNAAGELMAGRQPRRLVLLGQGELPPDARLLSDTLPGETWIIQSEQQKKVSKSFFKENNKAFKLIYLPAEANSATDTVSLSALLDFLGEQQITSVLIEGGMRVHHAFFAADLINEFHVSVSPVIIGEQHMQQPIKNKIVLKEMHCQLVGKDILLNARVK